MIYEELFIDTKLPAPLSKGQVYEYLKCYEKGDKIAREQLILHNIKLVIQQVNKKFKTTPYEQKELVSVGLLGLIKSIDTFDLSEKVEFSTYAASCITNEILMFLRNNKKHRQNVSFHDGISWDKEGKKLTLEDTLLDQHVTFVLDYETKESILEIRNLVESLEEREKEIIKLYFGFYQDTQYNQTEIANRLHLSSSYVSKIIKKTLQKLKNQLLNEETNSKKKLKKQRKRD